MDGKRVPRDELERRLWLMGLEEAERKRILEVAAARMVGPLALGEFVVRMRARSLEDMQLRARRRGWFERVWGAVKRWIPDKYARG